MSDDEGPIGRAVPQTCRDCGHYPHRHHEPTRDKSCSICGCPDLRAAKRERDDGDAMAHYDGNRLSEAGGQGFA